MSDSDGLKLTMELAVSGHEKISGINISNYSDVIDKIHIGSTAVVMHYPKTGMNITFIEEIGNEF